MSKLAHIVLMPANPIGKWISPYLAGWESLGSNFSNLDRGVCPKGATVSAVCPRCEERERAGVCPAPGTLGDVLSIFPRMYVLCVGGDCARHVGGYWPRSVSDRMRVIDIVALNVRLSHIAGQSLSPHLGIGGQTPGNLELYAARKRVLPLLAHLHAVHLAAREGVRGVVVLEGDIRPVPNNALSLNEVQQLRSGLTVHTWDVLRPSGYFNRAFPRGVNSGTAKSCLPACACHPVLQTHMHRGPAKSPRTCEVLAQKGIDHDDGTSGEGVPDFAAPFCDVRNPDLYAASSRAFIAFSRLRSRALASLRRAGELHSQGYIKAAQAELENTTNFPYIDMWIAARFNNLFILPQLAVQHIRQGEAYTSALFAARCRDKAAQPHQR